MAGTRAGASGTRRDEGRDGAGVVVGVGVGVGLGVDRGVAVGVDRGVTDGVEAAEGGAFVTPEADTLPTDGPVVALLGPADVGLPTATGEAGLARDDEDGGGDSALRTSAGGLVGTTVDGGVSRST